MRKLLYVPIMEPQTALAQLIDGCASLLREATKQHEATFGKITDDERWTHLFPLRFELQIRLLFQQGLDAFDLCCTGLKARASGVALGALRFLAEDLALVRWLTEPKDEDSRRQRSYRVVMGSIAGARSIVNREPDETTTKAGALQRLNEIETRLSELAREDGIQTVKEPLGTDELFERYMQEGYRFFGELSEFGSHPGFHQFFVFFDPTSKHIELDWTAAYDKRLQYTAKAFKLFADLCIAVGETVGWNEWLQTLVGPLIEKAARLLKEAKEQEGETA